MEGEREKSRDQNEGSGQQTPVGQQNDNQQPQDQSAEQTFDKADAQPQAAGQQSQPQGDVATREPGLQSDQQQSGDSSTGFVGSQGQESGEYLQKDGNPESGFAEQGQGASDQGDVERRTERSENRESDIEGSSDNS
jgi:hypothetical protein